MASLVGLQPAKMKIAELVQCRVFRLGNHVPHQDL